MKRVAVGVHLQRDDIEPLAEAIPAAGLFVSAIPVDDDQPLGDRELLLRVAELRSRLLDRMTFIAVRYGFTFQSQEELESRIAARSKRWRQLLIENRERVEVTLKVAARGAARPERHAFRSGADYLRALHSAKQAVSVDPDFRRSVEELIVPLCVKHSWMTRDATSIEFAGLIERARLAQLTEAGEALKAAHPDVPFLLSGPWPLEVFVDADQQ